MDRFLSQVTLLLCEREEKGVRTFLIVGQAIGGTRYDLTRSYPTETEAFEAFARRVREEPMTDPPVDV